MKKIRLAFFKTMKITFFLMFITCLQAWSEGFSQNTKVDIQVREVSIEKFLSLLERKTSYRFLINETSLPEDHRLTMDVAGKKLSSLLEEVLTPLNLTYRVFDDKLIAIARDRQSLQQNLVSGTVSDEKGVALPGVSITVQGAQTGTSSDDQGRFSLTVPPNAVLVFSYLGFVTREIPVQEAGELNIILREDFTKLSEVVVIGYGTQKKTTITGAVSTIRGEDLAALPAPDISHSIAGRLAGVSMRPNGGQPGYDDPDIHIRGVVTTGNNKPLVVVDGVKRDNIRQIDPSTIESITILKDAAAVAPYGIGGANGVILITTKKGVSGKPVVRLHSSYGFQNPTYLPEMLNAKDYMALQNEAYYNLIPDGTAPPNNPEMVAGYENLHREDPWKYPNSNFLDLFNRDVPVQNHNIELSGGTDKVNYHAGFGYYDQQGIFDPVNYQRYNYNISLEMDATPSTRVGMALHGSVERINEVDADEETSGHLFRSFYKFLPTQTLLYPEGDKWGESSANSPVGVLRSDGYKRTNGSTLLSTLFIEQQLIDGLSVKGVFSYDPYQGNIKSWHIPFIYHKIDLSQQPYSFTEAVSLQEGSGAPYRWLALENQKRANFTYQGYINYSKTVGDHSITGLLVAEARKSTNEWFSTRRNNFAIEIDEIDLGSSDKLDYDNAGSSETGSEIGYVYRLGYSYKDRYIFEAAGRYDGHYYFAPGKRWGYFPAFSAAWRISEERFLDKVSGLNELKLRASWGKAGMLAGEPFQYQAGYDLRGNAYAFGNGTLVQGSQVPREPNSLITWEISTKFNIGFDLNMWNGLLNLEFDYFHEDRSGMLLAPQVTLPVEYGLTLSQENKGKMDNNGFEVNVGTRKEFDNGLELNLNANFSYSMNNMIEVFETDAQRNNPNRTRVGRPFGTPYGFKSMGLFSANDDKNGDGIINGDDGYSVRQFGELHPGDIRYQDLSGPDGAPDGIIDDHDRTVIGHPVYPAATFGLMPSVYWKGLELSLFFQGASKSSINIRQFMTVPFENNGSNTGYEYYNNRWTAANQGGRYPRATPSPYNNNVQDSDFWWEDSGYLRLKTVLLGYTLPASVIQAMKIGSVRCYLSGQNLLTFSGIKHIDPEMGYDDRETAYPVMKSVTLGIDVTF